MTNTETAHQLLSLIIKFQYGSGKKMKTFWQQKRRMETFSGAQKHVNCFGQGIKCFCEIYLTWDGQPFVFSSLF